MRELNRLTVERGRKAEMEKIGSSGCEKQEDRLVKMESDRALKR